MVLIIFFKTISLKQTCRSLYLAALQENLALDFIGGVILMHDGEARLADLLKMAKEAIATTFKSTGFWCCKVVNRTQEWLSRPSLYTSYLLVVCIKTVVGLCLLSFSCRFSDWWLGAAEALLPLLVLPPFPFSALPFPHLSLGILFSALLIINSLALLSAHGCHSSLLLSMSQPGLLFTPAGLEYYPSMHLLIDNLLYP